MAVSLQSVNTFITDSNLRDHLVSTFTNVCETTVPEQLVEKFLQGIVNPPEWSTVRINHVKYETDQVLMDISSLIKQTYSDRGATIVPEVKLHSIIDDVVFLPNISQVGHVAPSYKRLIVDSLCGNSVLRGANVFGPGVMGAPKGVCKGEMVSVFADVDRKCRKGLCTEYTGQVSFVGNGQLFQDRSNWFTETPSNGIAVNMVEPVYVCPTLDQSSADLFYPQNFPSTIVSHVLDPRAGECILDMCASPGGKTVHIASLMNKKGCVIAIDKNSIKVSKLKKTVERFSCSECVHSFVFDSTKLTLSEDISSNSPSIVLPSSPPYSMETFDRVLLDGPCSGLGQRPSLSYNIKLSEVLSYQKYQRKLIKQAVQVLKKGGTFVYSTCTVRPQENEEQVKWILDNYPCMKLVEQDPFCIGYPGLANSFGLDAKQCAKVQRFGPKKFYSIFFEKSFDPFGDDCICFFIAKFIKKFS